MFTDFMIIDSWGKNASPWIKAIQNKEIESRNLTTNQSIINAIMNTSPRKCWMLDAGKVGW